MPANTSLLAKIFGDKTTLPLSTYIERANTLYYAAKDPLGSQGDFTTSPEISQIFGELIGLYILQFTLYAPNEPIALCEFGPGRGTLISDILRVLSLKKQSLTGLTIHMIENSPTLIEKQKQKLKDASFPIIWQTIEDPLPQTKTFFLANEFFDALPFEHFIFDGTNWRERIVEKHADNALHFALGKISTPPISAPSNPKHGDILEMSLLSNQIIKQWANHLKAFKGEALVIDYGHTHFGFGETLQALKNHRVVHPLKYPAQSDLTCHVNFAALAQTIKPTGVHINPTLTQHEFLLTLGFETRLTKLTQNLTPQKAEDIRQAALRLIEKTPTGMGELFKVLMFSCNSTNPCT